MAVYPALTLTQRGKELYAKAQAGKAIAYTRFRIGSGAFSGDPSVLNDLVEPIGYIQIDSFSRTGSTAHIKGVFQNTEIAQTVYSCELGLYAQDPDLGEILYAYANAGSRGDYIPSISAGPFSREFQINVVVGSASQVTADVPPAAYVTHTDFNAHVNDANIHVPRADITALETRIKSLEDAVLNDFNHNLFRVSFQNPVGVKIKRGWFDPANARLVVK